ncbi:hypothetical protein DEO72_LG10g3477 [Vigna unguiculata]|uniref:Uncharacterized protein n=1 Tax=Vigna unguiculata TaxID=3917 RepID=A0A4D6NEY2_VIGUN|nr:hypothetical protein DEO72_LG10g3477 [Vigna unguiculata]
MQARASDTRAAKDSSPRNGLAKRNGTNAAELARLRLLQTLAEVKAAVARGKDKAFF